MGKKRKASSSDSSESEDDKKKKKKESKKKKDKGKKKKEKGKKKKEKKSKKKQSSSSDSGSDSSDAKAKGQKASKSEVVAPPEHTLELQPPEEGIKRFEFAADEVGPLGLRFSGGFPPMILSVVPDSFAGKKGVPATWEVHAINGLALLPQNTESVMNSLKKRPVTLDVRPPGWKPAEKVREMEQKKAMEARERHLITEVENMRRAAVDRERNERAEIEAAEKKERDHQAKLQHEINVKKAREIRAQQNAKNREFEEAIAADPAPMRKAANELMEAEYGSSVNLDGTGCTRGLPLRLMTRRREVAWIWAGECMELIGGGAPEAGDSWS